MGTYENTDGEARKERDGNKKEERGTEPAFWLRDYLKGTTLLSYGCIRAYYLGPICRQVWRLSATSATCQRIPSGILECAEVVLQEPATRMLPPWDAEIAGRAGVHLWAFVICAYAHIYIQSAHAFGVDVLGDEPTGDVSSRSREVQLTITSSY